MMPEIEHKTKPCPGAPATGGEVTGDPPPLGTAGCVVPYAPDHQQAARTALACHDCGAPYDDPAWLDTCIPADDWEAISPPGGRDGVLCVLCMARRLVAVGRSDVPLLIGSGPFRHDLNYWRAAGWDAGRRQAGRDIAGRQADALDWAADKVTDPCAIELGVWAAEVRAGKLAIPTTTEEAEHG
jgi:hypothetical protein